jgi:hypothetical protein
MSEIYEIKYESVGFVEFRHLLGKALPRMGNQPRVWANAMKKAAYKTVVPAAKSAYGGLKGSGSLRQAMRAYNWPKGYRRGSFYPVHVGPKRGVKSALARYYAHYGDKVPTPSSVKYGIRHAHLVEWGHDIKNRKDGPVLGRVPGKRILETAFNASKGQVHKYFTANVDPEIKKEIQRVMRRKTRKRL